MHTYIHTYIYIYTHTHTSPPVCTQSPSDIALKALTPTRRRSSAPRTPSPQVFTQTSSGQN